MGVSGLFRAIVRATRTPKNQLTSVRNSCVGAQLLSFRHCNVPQCTSCAWLFDVAVRFWSLTERGDGVDHYVNEALTMAQLHLLESPGRASLVAPHDQA